MGCLHTNDITQVYSLPLGVSEGSPDTWLTLCLAAVFPGSAETFWPAPGLLSLYQWPRQGEPGSPLQDKQRKKTKNKKSSVGVKCSQKWSKHKWLDIIIIIITAGNVMNRRKYAHVPHLFRPWWTTRELASWILWVAMCCPSWATDRHNIWHENVTIIFFVWARDLQTAK